MKSIEIPKDPTESGGNHRQSIRMQTRRDGSVEVVCSESRDLVKGMLGEVSMPGHFDSVIALIPANRRAEIAEFLLKAV
jgi:hypothetical protein